MEAKPAGSAVPPIQGAEAMFHAYADMVYRLALMRTKSVSDAEDTVQEVFLRALRSGTRFASAEHQKAWFIRVTINCTKSLLTSAWRRHTAPEQENIPTEMAEVSDVYEAVRALPPDHRTAVHLYYYEGYSVREVAALTGSSESAVKSRLFRAREMLQERLKGEYFDV